MTNSLISFNPLQSTAFRHVKIHKLHCKNVSLEVSLEELQGADVGPTLSLILRKKESSLEDHSS